MIYTAKIEQTYAYPKRMKYLPATDSFVEKDCDSLSYVRNVRQPYGWLVESGTPPCEHLDVIVMTDKEYRLGDTEPVRIIGVFLRGDGDHKLVGVPLDREMEDFSQLPDVEREDLRRLYPRADKDEGWFGREAAEKVIRDFFARKRHWAPVNTDSNPTDNKPTRRGSLCASPQESTDPWGQRIHGTRR